MDLDQIARKRQAPVLTRANWQTWFEILELYIRGESLDIALDYTKRQYAWIQQPTNAPTSDGCWNTEKRTAYKATSAKVLYQITICIDETDKEFLKDFEGTKAKWEGLRAKYEKVRPYNS